MIFNIKYSSNPSSIYQILIEFALSTWMIWLPGDREVWNSSFFSTLSLSLWKISDDDVPPGVFPLSNTDSSQPQPGLQTDQKQTVWFGLQSLLCLHVPPDSTQNSTLGCRQTDPDHQSRRIYQVLLSCEPGNGVDLEWQLGHWKFLRLTVQV